MSVTEEIIRLAARGDGVTASGRHVSGTAPGDYVDAEGNITRGPHFQMAPCPHFGKCGGCQLQQIDDAAYADFATARITHALLAQNVAVPTIRVPHLSPEGARRRATLKAIRPGKSVLLGFMAQGSHQVVDLKHCDVLHPQLTALIAPLRKLLQIILAPRATAQIHLTLADQGPDILIAGPSAEGLEAHDALLDFCSAHKIARLAIDAGDGPEDRWAPEPVTITLGTFPVGLPHAAFLQATRDGEAALIDAVREAVGDAVRVADLFSGLGTFSLTIAEGRRVTSAEAARNALFALKLAANRAQLPIEADHRDLYRRPFMTKDLAAFDAVVLDPPRAGAEMQVQELAPSTVRAIAYVSCNPASFARDAAILTSGGYTLDWIQPVGQFRWSTHVELAARFSRT